MSERVFGVDDCALGCGEVFGVDAAGDESPVWGAWAARKAWPLNDRVPKFRNYIHTGCGEL